MPNDELLNMFNLAGLNRILTYGTWLGPHIQAAKEDPVMLKLLQGLRSVSYTGVALSKTDDDWCFQNGIPIAVSIYLYPIVFMLSDEKTVGCVWHNRMR